MQLLCYGCGCGLFRPALRRLRLLPYALTQRGLLTGGNLLKGADKTTGTVGELIARETLSVHYLYGLHRHGFSLGTSLGGQLVGCGYSLAQCLLRGGLFDGLFIALLEDVATQRFDAAAQIPTLVLVDALLRKLQHPALQLLVVGYILDQCIGRAGEHRLGVEFDVVVELYAQLLDKGSEDALEEFVDREDCEVRVVVQNLRTQRSGTLHYLLACKLKVALEVFEVVTAVGVLDQVVDLLQDTALHLLGGLVGKGHGEDGTIQIGLCVKMLDRIVDKLICQTVGLTRTCAGAEY